MAGQTTLAMERAGAAIVLGTGAELSTHPREGKAKTTPAVLLFYYVGVLMQSNVLSIPGKVTRVKMCGTFGRGVRGRGAGAGAWMEAS